MFQRVRFVSVRQRQSKPKLLRRNQHQDKPRQTDRSHWSETSHFVTNLEDLVKENEHGPNSLKFAETLLHVGQEYMKGTSENGMVPLQPFRAKFYLEKSLPIWESNCGPYHVNVGRTLMHIANALRYLRPVDTMEDLGGIGVYDDILIINNTPCLSENDYHKLLDGKVPADRIEALIWINVALGRRKPMRDVLERAVPILRENLDENSVELGMAKGLLGNACLRFNDLENARINLTEAIQIFENIMTVNPDPKAVDKNTRLTVLQNIGDAAGWLGQLYLRKSDPPASDKSPLAPETRELYLTLALDSLAHSVRYKRAFYGYDERGLDHPDISEPKIFIGAAQFLRKQYSEAKAVLDNITASPFDSRVPGSVAVRKQLDLLSKNLASVNKS